MYTGINLNIIKNSSGVNSWLSILLSYFISIIPLLLYIYISKYEETLPLNEKIKKLFPHTHHILNTILNLTIITIGITVIYNVSNFITSQLLYRTPQLVISILLIALSTYNVIKGINTITRVSLIMTTFNIILFLISFFTLIKHVNPDNFLPFLKNDTNHIFTNALKLTSINTLPLILLLKIPKSNINNKNNYNLSIIISFIIASTISFLTFIIVYGILGTYLVNIFEYPEYIVLKKIVLFGFLERIENIICNQWLVGNYIYLTLIIYYLNTSSCISKKINNKFLSPLFGAIILLLSTNLFKNNTIFNYYIKNYLPYITSILLIFYIIIPIKIFIQTTNSNST